MNIKKTYQKYKKQVALFVERLLLRMVRERITTEIFVVLNKNKTLHARTGSLFFQEKDWQLLLAFLLSFLFRNHFFSDIVRCRSIV